MGQTDLLIIIFLLIAAGFAIASMQAAWHRRHTPGARSFSWMMLSAALWTLGAALEYSSHTYSLILFWAKFQYLGIATLPLFWMLFCIDYSQVQSPLAQRSRALTVWLALIPAVTIALALTNDLHGLVWTQVRVVSNAPRVLVEYEHGPWFAVIVTYNYALLLFGTLNLGWSIARFPEVYGRKSAALIVGAAIPWLANFLYLAGYRLAPGLDITPVAFVIAGVIYSVQVFRLHLLDLVPVARDTVIESMQDGVAVVDNNGRIAYINPAGRAILNLPDAEIAEDGMDLPRWPEIAGRWGQAGESGDFLVVTEAAFGERRARRIEIHTSPLIQAGTRTSGQLILLRDVTVQYDAKEQLRLQSVALQAAPNAVIITDRSGKIIWTNPAFTTLTGFTSAEATGKNPRILKSGNHDPTFYHTLWQTILSGRNWHGELVNRRKDGAVYIEDATIAPVLNSQGEITHFIAIKQNITERKELEKMRDDLMQAIVHDLRNPLNSILFSLDMVQRMPPIEQVPVEILSTIEISRENAWRMLGMINSILDLSRLESGSLPLMREKVMLAELVEQSIHAQSMIAQRHEALILNDVPYDLPLVSVDRLLISRVLQNLLDNAIKFTNQGSNIEVNACLDEKNSCVIVSVRDEGPGIPSELQASIFQKFVTGPSPRRGSGLGLAFCRLAVEAHAGRIWAESAKDKGTLFFFTLPVEIEKAPGNGSQPETGELTIPRS